MLATYHILLSPTLMPTPRDLRCSFISNYNSFIWNGCTVLDDVLAYMETDLSSKSVAFMWISRPRKLMTEKFVENLIIKRVWTVCDKLFALLLFILWFCSKSVLRYLKIQSGNTWQRLPITYPHTLITKIARHCLPRLLTTYSPGNRHPQVRNIPNFAIFVKRTSGRKDREELICRP